MYIDGPLGVAVLVISDHIPVFLNGFPRQFFVPAHVRSFVLQFCAVPHRRCVLVVQVCGASICQLPAGRRGRRTAVLESLVHFGLRPAAAGILVEVEIVSAGAPVCACRSGNLSRLTGDLPTVHRPCDILVQLAQQGVDLLHLLPHLGCAVSGNVAENVINGPGRRLQTVRDPLPLGLQGVVGFFDQGFLGFQLVNFPLKGQLPLIVRQVLLGLFVGVLRGLHGRGVGFPLSGCGVEYPYRPFLLGFQQGVLLFQHVRFQLFQLEGLVLGFLGVLQRSDLLVNGGCLLVPCFLCLFQLFVNGIFQFVPKILLQFFDLLGDLPMLRGQGVDVRLTGPDPPHILRLCVERRLDLPHLVDLVRRAAPTLLHERKLRLPQGYDVLQPFQFCVLLRLPRGRFRCGRFRGGHAANLNIP